MCGVVGIFNRKGPVDISHVLLEACDVIAHRGPDGSGSIVYDNVIGLGHRRLSIVDLSDRGKQPMVVSCSCSHNTYTIVFNGEIYNYKELRSELVAKGHIFTSDSDTEVIIHSYEEWGESVFSRFRGMFAFALWDARARTLICARDMFGIKPFYYCVDEKRFIFASELKALKPFGVAQDISLESVSLFLRQGWIAQPNTLYQNVSSLEAGTVLYISESSIVQKKFVSLSDIFNASEYENLSYGEAKQKVRDVLRNSVAAHCIADVEVGAFLSGGIDSSSVVALMRELGKKDITTVSAIFPGTQYDESNIINQSVQAFNTRHVSLPITGNDFLSHLDSIINSMDQPSIDGANTYFVSLAAKHAGLRVVLSGLGGDELFYGYPIFRHIPFLYNFRFLNSLTRKLPPITAAFSKISVCAHAYKGEQGFSRACNAYRSLFSSEQVSALVPILSPFNTQIGNGAPQLMGNHDVEKRISYHETTHYMKEQLLRDGDVFSMAHSLELRVPFVDSRVYDVIARIPSKYKKARGGITKPLLVDAMKDILPNHLFSVKKQGFVLPIDMWLSGPARGLVLDELSRSMILSRKETLKVLNAFAARKLHWSRVWALFVVNRFLN